MSEYCLYCLLVSDRVHLVGSVYESFSDAVLNPVQAREIFFQPGNCLMVENSYRCGVIHVSLTLLRT